MTDHVARAHLAALGGRLQGAHGVSLRPVCGA